MALEEVVLFQIPPQDELPPVMLCTEEPSQTPETSLLGVKIHSGETTVSRGGAPTSALIARGNDYPGSFSHVALVHVDERTGRPSVIESHIEGKHQLHGRVFGGQKTSDHAASFKSRPAGDAVGADAAAQGGNRRFDGSSPTAHSV